MKNAAQILKQALRDGGEPNILSAAAYYLAVRDMPGFAEYSRKIAGSSAAQVVGKP
jgi:hypothetical protein